MDYCLRVESYAVGLFLYATFLLLGAVLYYHSCQEYQGRRYDDTLELATEFVQCML